MRDPLHRNETSAQRAVPDVGAPSVLSSWTRVIMEALEALDIDPMPVLLDGGFSADAFRDPNARLPALATARLWRKAATRAGDPAFGLFASRFVRPTTFHALGYAVFASTTLRDAMTRLLRYSHLVSDAAELQLTTDRTSARLSFVRAKSATRVAAGESLTVPHDSDGSLHMVPSAEATDAVMSLIVRTCRVLTDRSFVLLEVEQRRPEPALLSPWERFFRCPIHFGRPIDALTFDAASLDRHLPTANPELARHNDDLVRQYLADMREGTVVDRLRRALSEHLSGDVSPKKLAGLLGLSIRSLQRRLQEQGTSYAEVLRDTRRELAMSYLKQPQCSVAEVAFLLGFEDASAFARAFRSWTGVSPSEFRAAP
ncbi:MAG: putative transcription factor, AraC family [Myxococcaceae bacterium]|nr:putative transcription factor, AraC family [Myxococcaceae bacterium]